MALVPDTSSCNDAYLSARETSTLLPYSVFCVRGFDEVHVYLHPEHLARHEGYFMTSVCKGALMVLLIQLEIN
jgi:hypothetical protein